MYRPRISIVTPSFNQGAYLEQTIKSVLNQNYPNLEYIIIDGGSTDNSVDIIKKYEKFIHYWVSEPDRGQSDAINKGVAQCSGEIFNWINSDDYLADGALERIAEEFKEGVGTVAGSVQNFDESGLDRLYKNSQLSVKDMLDPEAKYIYHQPGVWLRTDIMKEVGEF